MLLKIFAAIGPGGSVLHTLLAGQTGNALETTGILLLRFLEYFFGAHIAYVLVMLLSTELFIRKSKPQEKPSKFWLWHLHAVADLLCFYARADVSITGTELIPKDTWQTTARLPIPSSWYTRCPRRSLPSYQSRAI